MAGRRGLLLVFRGKATNSRSADIAESRMHQSKFAREAHVGGGVGWPHNGVVLLRISGEAQGTQ